MSALLLTSFRRQLGDCHSFNCLKEWYPNVSNITVTKYAFEMLEIFNPDRLEHSFPALDQQLLAHSPDSANSWDFWPIPWQERTTDVKMFGFTGSCKLNHWPHALIADSFNSLPYPSNHHRPLGVSFAGISSADSAIPTSWIHGLGNAVGVRGPDGHVRARQRSVPAPRGLAGGFRQTYAGGQDLRL